MNYASWIGLPHSEIARANILEGDMNGRFAYFTYAFELPEGAALKLDISASSRYRLFANGESVTSGPSKGDKHRHYYETVDVSAYLKKGKNLLAVQVLYQDPYAVDDQMSDRAAIYAIVGPGGGHRLAVEGKALDKDGAEILDVSTGIAPWRVHLDDSYYLVNANLEVYFLGATAERFDADKTPAFWRSDASVSEEWPSAETKRCVVQNAVNQSVGVLPMIPLVPRDIPLLYEKEVEFAREMTDTGIIEEGFLVVPAGEKTEVILESGFVMNTFPKYTFTGGRNGTITMSYFEKFVKEGEDIARDDMSGEVYYPLVDTIRTNGKAFCFEPFWYRTFRFLKLELSAGDTELVFDLPRIRRMGYPLPIESGISSSAPWVEKLFDMSVKTLEGCMVESYMDCPMYEQLQYPMDTRLQILFNSSVSSDLDLVRKAILDFHSFITPCGLLPGKAPTAYMQMITTFSLHYIFILWEYYVHTGDVALIRHYRSDLDRILDYYEEHLDENGLVAGLGYWPFVDWQPVWRTGVPDAEKEGGSAIISLMYAYALENAARITEVTGRKAVAEEYRDRKQNICDAVERSCYDAQVGLYREGPRTNQFSTHAQSWAVLNGMRTGEEAAALMERTVGKEGIVPMSFSTAYEFFRACEMAGRYDLTRKCFEQWIGLIDLHCNTCPETPVDCRSECHAWSALPIYELLRAMAGIMPGEAGWKSIVIRPHLDYVPDLKGAMITPVGEVRFDYHKDEDGEWVYDVETPDGVEWELRID